MPSIADHYSIWIRNERRSLPHILSDWQTSHKTGDPQTFLEKTLLGKQTAAGQWTGCVTPAQWLEMLIGKAVPDKKLALLLIATMLADAAYLNHPNANINKKSYSTAVNFAHHALRAAIRKGDPIVKASPEQWHAAHLRVAEKICSLIITDKNRAPKKADDARNKVIRSPDSITLALRKFIKKNEPDSEYEFFEKLDRVCKQNKADAVKLLIPVPELKEFSTEQIQEWVAQHATQKPHHAGELLKFLRQAEGFYTQNGGQAGMDVRTGIDGSVIASLERGEYSLTLYTLKRIGNAGFPNAAQRLLEKTAIPGLDSNWRILQPEERQAGIWAKTNRHLAGVFQSKLSAMAAAPDIGSYELSIRPMPSSVIFRLTKIFQELSAKDPMRKNWFNQEWADSIYQNAVDREEDLLARLKNKKSSCPQQGFEHKLIEIKQLNFQQQFVVLARTIAKELKITQRDLAEKIGSSLRQVGLHFSGQPIPLRRSLPMLDVFRKENKKQEGLDPFVNELLNMFEEKIRELSFQTKFGGVAKTIAEGLGMKKSDLSLKTGLPENSIIDYFSGQPISPARSSILIEAFRRINNVRPAPDPFINELIDICETLSLRPA